MKVEVQNILSTIPEHSEAAYQEYLAHYAENFGTVPSAEQKMAVALIRDFVLLGLYPVATRNPIGVKLYDRLNDKNKDILDSYLHSLQGGFHENSIKRERKAIISYLSYLQRSGLDYENVSERQIWGFFFDPLTGHRQSSHTICAYIRRFYTFLSETRGGHYGDKLIFIPHLKEPNPIYPRLTGEEYDLLEKFVSTSGSLSLRDTAIMRLAMSTGMRASDIANLKFGDIDFYGEHIKVNQVKTGKKVEVKLLPSVGNAIYEYCMKERPESDSDFVFLLCNRSRRPMTSEAVSSVATSAFKKAGVRVDGGRKGSHILRYEYASRLLESGADFAIIYQLLGHSSPETAFVYLQTDHKRLYDCSLDLDSILGGDDHGK